MNKIYKVVWCHVRNTYVVASELASRKKNTGKSSGSLLKPIVLGMAIAFSVGGGAINAAESVSGGGKGVAISAKPSRGETCEKATAANQADIAIGCNAETSNTNGSGTTFYDRANPKNVINTAQTYYAIAVGDNSTAERGSVSLGSGAESMRLGVALGAQARSKNVAALAIGPAALALGNTSLALGRQSAAIGDFSQAIGNVSIAEGKGSLAMGHSATATGNRSIAIGSADIDNAGSTGDQQGVKYQEKQQTLSTGKDSIAIGAAAKAQGDYTLAVGAHAKASGSNSTAMGYDASATGKDSFAAGRSANAEGQDAFALGAKAHGQGVKSFAMGTGSKAIGENALALGSLSVAKEKNSIAVGVGSQANFADSVALGSGAVVSHENSLSIGTKSTTNDYDATAFLFEDGVAGAVATGAVSIGNGKGTVSEGSNERRLQNLAAGSLDTDAVNVSQLKLHKVITDKTGTDIAKHLGGNSTFNIKTGAVTTPTYVITNKDGTSKNKYTNVGSAFEALDSVVVNNTTNIQKVFNGEAGIIQVATDGKSLVIDNTIAKNADVFNIAGGPDKSGSRKLTGLKNGAVEKGSRDAVTGDQLHDVSELVDVNTKNITKNKDNLDLASDGLALALGGGVAIIRDDENNFTFKKPAYELTNKDNQKKITFDNVGDALGHLDTNIQNINEGKAGLIQLSGDGKTLVVDNNLAKEATSFNIGNGSVDRTLAGVAAGQLLNDAVNVSQLKDATELLGGNATVNSDGSIQAPTYNITNVGSTTDKQEYNTVGDALDALDAGVVNNTTNITNLENKTGESLSGIADAFGAGAEFDKDGKLTAPNYSKALGLDGSDGKETIDSGVEAGFEHVGGKLAAHDQSITNIEGDINNITTGKSGLVKLSDTGEIVIDNALADKATFNLANKDGSARTLTGVAAGKVAANSVDAINGSQLHAANTKVAEVIGGGAGVDADGNLTDPTFNITDVNGDTQEYFNVGSALDALDTGVVNNTTNITNLENKTGESLSGIADAFGAGAEFDKDGKLTAPNYSKALGLDGSDGKETIDSGVEAGFEHVGGKLAAHDQSITNIEGDINNITTGKSGLVKLSDTGEIVIDNALADKATFNLANKDGSARTLTGVAAGKVAANSVDAINGSQLHAANTKVAEVIGGGAGVDADGNLTDPTFNITDVNGDMQEYFNVGSALDALDAGVVNNTTNITNLENKTGESLSGIADAFGAGAEFDKDGKLTAPNYSKALGLDGSDGKETIDSGVEAGFEHVGGKLAAHDQSITNIEGDINNITTGKSGLVKLSDTGEIVIDNALANKATFNLANKDGSARTLTGVAAGKVTANSVDAINGSQLFDTNVNIANIIGGDAVVNAETGVIEGSKFLAGLETGEQVPQLDDEGKPVVDADGNPVMVDAKTTGFNNITDAFDSLGKKDQALVDALGGGATVNVDGSITGPNYKDVLGSDKDLNNVEEGFGYVKDQLTGITTGTAGLIQLSKDGKSLVVDNETAKDATSFNIAGEDANRKLTGVAKGDVKADSVDAINGSQLHAANTKVAEVIGGGAEVDAEGNLTDPTFNITDVNGDPQEYFNVGSALDALDAGVVNNTTNITNLEEKSGASLEGIAEALGGNAAFDKDTGVLSGVDFKDALGADKTVESVYEGFEYVGNQLTDIETGKSGLIQLSDDGKTLVVDNKAAKDAETFDLTNKQYDDEGNVITSSERKLTGVANGNVNANSVDAVNGSQLFTAKEDLANIIAQDIIKDDGSIEAPKFVETIKVVQKDAEGKPILDDEGNPVLVEQKQTGFNTIKEAIDSLGQGNATIADSLGGGSTVNVDGSITGPTYNITNKDGDTVTVNNVGDALTTIDNSVTNITNGKSGLVQLSDDNKAIIIDNNLAKEATSFDIAGKNAERKLTGVAKGDVKADSVDAINGSQLFDTNVNIANIIGGDAAVNAETGVIEGSKFLAGLETGEQVPQLDDEGKPVVDADGNPVMVDAKTTGFNNITDAFDSLGKKDQALVDALGGGAAVNVDGSITGPNYKDVLGSDKDLNNVEEGFGYVKDQLTGITTGTAGLIQLSKDGKSLVVDNETAKDATSFNIAGEDANRKLTGVANGNVNANSVDAVNGSQLFTAKEDLANIIAKDIIKDDGSIEAPKFVETIKVVQKDAEGKPVLDDEGNPVLVEQKQTGFNTIKEAIDSLGQGNATIADSLGGGSTVNVDGSITDPTYNITNKDGDTVTVNNVGDALTTIDNSVTNITNGKSGLVQLSDDNKTIIIDNNLAKEATSFNIAGKDAERKLTGVANGDVNVDSVDAINGSQLFDAKKDLADIIAKDIINVDGSIEAPTFIDTIQVVKKDADGNVVLDDAGKPVLVTQTQDGFNTIKEAIDSLGQGNAMIVDSLGGGSVVNPDGTITGPTYVINGDNYYNVGDAITNIDGRVIDNSTKIDDITNNITTGKTGLVQLDGNKIVIDNNAAKSANTFDISNGKDARKLTGVAVGHIGKDSTDAINGGQLYATGEYIAKHLGGGAKMTRDGVIDVNFKEALDADGDLYTVEAGFEYLSNSIQNGEMGLLQMKNGKLVFSDVAKKATEFDVSGEDGAMKVTNVANGKVAVDSLDAINGSQLYATNKSIVDSLGGGAGLKDDGTIQGPTYNIDGTNYYNVGDAITNIDGRVIDNTKDITNLTENINNINTGKAGLVMIDGDRIVFDSSIAGGRTFDISNNGQARKMTGVADGTLAAGSKDAVNGGQLYDTNQNVAKNSDNIGKTTDALGGGAGIDKDGNYKGPNYSFTDGSNHTNVGSALDNLDGRVTDLDKKVDGIANGTEGLVKLETDENGNQKLVIDNNLASKADTFDISNGDQDRTLTGVKDGKVESGSKDAINGGQLHDSNQSIADIFGGGASIDKDGYVSMPNYDFGDNNTFNNVGDSLTHLNNKITNGEGGLFKLDRENNQIILADNKDINKETVVNMGDRKIVGVANGKVEKDSLEAVNGGQLWETNQQVSTNTNQIKHINNTLNHYNTRMNNLEKTVHENRKRASAGTASAMAMSSIPYLDYAKYSFGMGVASYDGEAAMSLGLEFRMGDNGRFRIQGSYDTQNKAGVGVGMAFEL